MEQISTRRPGLLQRSIFVIVPLAFVGFIAYAVFGKQSNVTAGETVPDFSAKTFEGETVRLSQFAGRPVFINFWASWCVPCRQEAKDLAITHERYADTDLVMIGVNSEDLRPDALKYLDQYGIRYLNVRDTGTRIGKQTYGVRAYPETFLVDRQGRLVERVFGPMTSGEMKDRIDRLLAT